MVLLCVKNQTGELLRFKHGLNYRDSMSEAYDSPLGSRMGFVLCFPKALSDPTEKNEVDIGLSFDYQ